MRRSFTHAAIESLFRGDKSIIYAATAKYVGTVYINCSVVWFQIEFPFTPSFPVTQQALVTT